MKLWQKFFEDEDFIAELKGTSAKSVRHILKLLDSRPTTFENCIAFARLKFQGYFHNNILQLVRTYPNDLQLKDGSMLLAFYLFH